jgi:flagellar motor protein MotB
MRRRRSRDRGASENFWPVVADAFVGILAVFVFVLIGYQRRDPAIDEARAALTQELERAKQQGLVDRYTVGLAGVRIIYSADRLSFEPCGWDLPEESAEVIRNHLRSDLFKRASISEIRIEGHADRRSVSACPGITPYKDNLQLSQNRARAVYNSLLGLSALGATTALDDLLVGNDGPMAPPGLEYLRNLARAGRLYVAGLGGMKPLDAGDPAAAINRRVEIAIEFGKPAEPPGAGVASAYR